VDDNGCEKTNHSGKKSHNESTNTDAPVPKRMRKNAVPLEVLQKREAQAAERKKQKELKLASKQKAQQAKIERAAWQAQVMAEVKQTHGITVFTRF
jgi:hypothetical protein